VAHARRAAYEARNREGHDWGLASDLGSLQAIRAAGGDSPVPNQPCQVYAGDKEMETRLETEIDNICHGKGLEAGPP
jgi:hypothetical protein